MSSLNTTVTVNVPAVAVASVISVVLGVTLTTVGFSVSMLKTGTGA